MSHRRLTNPKIELARGDITAETVDAIVNAANADLLPGAGVCGAIRDKGGALIFDECARVREVLGALAPGQAAITGAGRLPCRHVIHAVGPIWRGGSAGEAEALASCYRESLALAAAHGLRSVAFPSLATGLYGYPLQEAAPVALAAVNAFLARDSPIERVRFVLFSDADLEAYATALDSL